MEMSCEANLKLSRRWRVVPSEGQEDSSDVLAKSAKKTSNVVGALSTHSAKSESSDSDAISWLSEGPASGKKRPFVQLKIRAALRAANGQLSGT